MSEQIPRTVQSLFTTGGTLGQRVARGGGWAFFSFGSLQVLGLIRSIILARLLAPSDFGLMSLVWMAIAALGVFAEMGLGPALIQREDVSRDVLNTAWVIQILRGTVLCAVALVASPYIAAFFQAPLLEPILKVIAFTMLIAGFNSVGLILLQKDLDFRRLAYFKLITVTSSVVVTVMAAFILRSVWALVIGELAQAIVWLIASFIVCPFRPKIYLDRRLAGELLGYGKHILGAGVVNYLLTQGDDALVGKVLGTAPLGFYGLAYRLSNMPATGITHIISQVTFPAYSEIQDDPEALKRAYLKTLKFTAMLSVPLAGGLFALAPEIVSVFYGEKWLPMVPSLMVLCLFGLERSIGATVGPLFLGIGKPQLVLYVTLVKLCVMALVIYPLTLHYGIFGTSLAVTLSAVAVQMVVMPTAAKLIQCRLSTLLRTLLHPFCGAGIMIAMLFSLKAILALPVSLYSLLSLTFIGSLTYFCYIWMADRDWIREATSVVTLRAG